MAQIKDIRTVAEQRGNFFFLAVRGANNRRLPIRRLQESSFIVPPPGDFRMLGEVSGFMIAEGGRGIYHMRGTVEDAQVTDDTFDLVSVHIDMDSVRFENRREFYRVQMIEPVTASLVREEGASVEAQVYDVSAGGIRIKTSDTMVLGEMYRLDFSVVMNESVMNFSIPVEVVHDLVKYDSQMQGFYGLMHAVSGRASTADRREYDEIQRTVIRFVNDYQKFLEATLADQDNA